MSTIRVPPMAVRRTTIPGPTWGYHFQGINFSLGSLVNDVHAAEIAYSS